MGATIPINKIIFFDGVCNLCSASVQFIIKRDPKQKYRFASLQSDYAKKVLAEFNVAETLRTIVLVDGKEIYFRSDAALEISRGLKGLWPALTVLKIIPRFIRDAIYNFIAQNRYRWFGKKDECWIPSPEWQNRFLE